MRRFLFAVAAIAFAAQAGAHPPADIERSIPRAADVEAVGEVVDRVVGAVLDVPVGPILDAVEATDPERRHRRPFRRDQTLRDVAGRDDPYFEERLRDSIHGVTAGVGAAMEQAAVLAPVLSRSIEEVERSVSEALYSARHRDEVRHRRR